MQNLFVKKRPQVISKFNKKSFWVGKESLQSEIKCIGGQIFLERCPDKKKKTFFLKKEEEKFLSLKR
jgi:hypothetical protein